jgi:hypothetical protein
MVGRLKGSEGDLEIGLPVRASFTRVDDGLTLVDWVPSVSGQPVVEERTVSGQPVVEERTK